MTKQILVQGEGGARIHMDLPLPDHIEDRLRTGLIRRINEDGTPFIERDDDVAAPPTEAPKASATKKAWLEWAVACGADPEEAELLAKQDLVDRYAEAAPA